MSRAQISRGVPSPFPLQTLRLTDCINSVHKFNGDSQSFSQHYFSFVDKVCESGMGVAPHNPSLHCPCEQANIFTAEWKLYVVMMLRQEVSRK